MSHEIFVSYSSKHRDATRLLVAAIEAQYGAGSVWWDHELEARGPYAPQIRAALDAARVVVVLWTAGAQLSEYVYAEATAAHASHKLVNFRPADTTFAQIPEPFNIHHVEDLSATDRVLRAISATMTGRPVGTLVPLHELYFRQYGQRLLDAKQSTLPTDVRDISPSQLLQARYQRVSYLDANGQAAELLDWTLNDSRSCAGRLIYGPGGVGKTRLLIDVAARLAREHAWTAGFVEPLVANVDDAQRRQRAQALRQLLALNDDSGLLLVLDYAEGRQDDLVQMSEWIEACPTPSRRPVRLVLLARSNGDWWSRLTEQEASLQTLFRSVPDRPAATELLPLQSTEQRFALFEAACAAFRPVLAAQGLLRSEHSPTASRPGISGGGSNRNRPLAIQMAALVWLMSEHRSSRAPATADLLDQVLGLERRHWRRVCGMLDDAALLALERALAQLTLVQGVRTQSAAEELLANDSYYKGMRGSPVSMAPLLGHLQRLYGDGCGGLRPLEPDLLGEHLVARTIDNRLFDACVSWVDDAEDAALLHRRKLTTVLQRATAAEHGPRCVTRVAPLLDRLIDGYLNRWASAVVSTIVETPGELLQRLESRITKLDAIALSALDNALPVHTLALAKIATKVARRLLDLELAVADRSPGYSDFDHLSHLAPRWGTLGSRLFILGRNEDALTATRHAVQGYRDLFKKQRQAAFVAGLATGLNNLGNILTAIGQHAEAKVATERAVRIRRCLATAWPETYRSDLAMSLNNLGRTLADLNRTEAALTAAEEAVRVYRDLSNEGSVAVLPDLANSLNNLGNWLAEVGRREEALVVTKEATEIRRSLAQRRPDSFIPDLATSLNNLGIRLSGLGFYDDALAFTEEAVRLHRDLARVRPEAYLPDLAMSLNNLGNRLGEVGRRDDALAPAREAVDIYRDLAKDRPSAFLPDVAMSLENLGNALANLGRWKDALRATEEAFPIRQRFARAWPDKLAGNLHNRGWILTQIGRGADALVDTEQALTIRLRLVAERPDAYLPDLAISYGAHSSCLAALGRHAEAAATTVEGIVALLPLVRRFPAAFGELAFALGRAHSEHAKAAGSLPNSVLNELATILGLGDDGSKAFMPS